MPPPTLFFIILVILLLFFFFFVFVGLVLADFLEKTKYRGNGRVRLLKRGHLLKRYVVAFKHILKIHLAVKPDAFNEVTGLHRFHQLTVTETWDFSPRPV